MPFNDWFDEVATRLNGMGYEEAPSPNEDPRWRWLLREEPLLRRVFILADSGIELEELRDIMKMTISRWRKADHPVRIGILATGHIRELSLISDISWVGAIWALQERGIRLLYHDGRWDVEDHILRRRISFTSDQGRQEKAGAVEHVHASSSPSMTYFLMIVCALVFVIATLMGGSDKPDVLLALGAKDAPRIWLGEYWRLLTPIFYHIGYIHIFFNLLALYFLGPIIERLMGKWRLLLIYVVSGLFGVLAGMITLPFAISAGASGATFGLLGAWALSLIRRPKAALTGLNRTFFLVYAAVFLIGALNANIGIFGHLAGLIGGVLFAGAFGEGRKVPIVQKRPWLISVGLTLIIMAIAALYPPPSGWFIPFDRGRSALYHRDWDMAIDQLGLSLQRERQNTLARFFLAKACLARGEARYRQGDYSGAVDDFKTGISARDSWELHYDMAKAYYQMERPEDAMMEVDRALELNPGNEIVKKYRDDLKNQIH